jgi:branched-chain amino acid transport system substrate-binding protein
MLRNKKTLWIIGLLLLTGLVLSACGGTGGEGEPIKVGAIHDLTGPTSDVGQPYADGLRDYVEWRNENGGINGRQIELISSDYGYQVDQAEALYTQYVQEGVVAFQGWGTGDTEALRTRIAEDMIPFMSASYSANLLDMDAAPFNFLIGTSYSDQAIIAVQWAIDDWAEKGNSGTPTVAIAHHDSPFGQSPVPDAQAFAEANGVEFTSLAMPGNVTDYVAELAQLQQAGADYVIIQNVSSPAAVLTKDAESQGLKDEMQIVCLNWCADELFISLAGDAAEGVVGTLPFTPPSVPVGGHEEPAAWLEAHDSSLEEKGLHYVQGWWTMDVMAAGIERALEEGGDLTGESVRAGLESIQNYDTEGVSAPITFSATSHKGNNSLRLFRVENGQWVQISDYILAP